MAVGAAAFGAAMLNGCATYANYPAIGTADDDAAVNDPNVAPTPTVARAAVRHIVERFPVEGAYVVNLPEGMTRRRAEEVILLLRDPNANLPSPATAGLPVYHVTKVWVRPAGHAEVEVIRPVFGVGTPGDVAEFQPVTVRLRRSPLENWQVDSVRVWPIGLKVPPPLYGWDAGDSGDAAGEVVQ